VSAPVLAAEGDPIDAPAREASSARSDGFKKHGAYVVVFNRRIVRFRAPILGVPVEQRAENAAERIRTLLQAPGAHTVTTERISQGIMVKIDGHIAFAITNEDAERLGDAAEQSIASDAVRHLEQVIVEMKEARDPRALLIAAGWTAVGTGIWLALLRAPRCRWSTARRVSLAAAGAAMRAAGHRDRRRARAEAIHFGLRVAF
jgi:hypothetical protein